MPLSLHPLTAGDFTPLTPLQYAAFHPVEKLHMLIYPSPTPPNPEIYARTVARRLKSFGKDEWEWVKVVDDTTCEIGKSPSLSYCSLPLYKPPLNQT